MAAILCEGDELKQPWRWWNNSRHDVDCKALHIISLKLSLIYGIRIYFRKKDIIQYGLCNEHRDTLEQQTKAYEIAGEFYFPHIQFTINVFKSHVSYHI